MRSTSTQLGKLLLVMVPVAIFDQQNVRKKFWMITIVVAEIAIYAITHNLYE
jgi:hypothetical protein